METSGANPAFSVLSSGRENTVTLFPLCASTFAHFTVWGEEAAATIATFITFTSFYCILL
jgi:hypothetical protein